MVDQAQNPVPAEISYGVAIIPANPLKNRVAAASMDITKSFDNDNVIDNVRFPAHISLYLGGTARDRVPVLIDAIRTAVRPHMQNKLKATRLYSGHGGFIGVEVEDDSTSKALFEKVIAACAEVHRANPYVRPHLIDRWSRMRREQRDSTLRMGTYKIDPSNLHISVAIVDPQDLNSAFVVAQKHFSLPEEFGIESVQLVDVGHHNEKWFVLWNSEQT